ncbi:Helicase-like [Calothrix sp. PCC 7716]|nr:Helicase-like [Calothrix sp. PCC 7716]
MPNHIANRDKIVQALRQEMVGSSPQGEKINCAGDISFSTEEEFYKPRRQDNGEEILQRDPPLVRYGVGVLHPTKTKSEQADSISPLVVNTNIGNESTNVGNTDTDNIDLVETEAKKDLENIEKNILESSEVDSNDFDLTTANSTKPSSMGISFRAEFPQNSVLKVTALNCACYVSKQIKVNSNQRTWWLRKPISITKEFSREEIFSPKQKTLKYTENINGLNLSIEVYSRPDTEKREDVRLLTVCLINRTDRDGSHENCLFQAEFDVTVVSPNGEGHILPYPKQNINLDDEEEQSLSLLYRTMQTYAVGHGCAADWDLEIKEGKVKTVVATCFPTYETPSITPDITRKNKSKIEVPMAPLAGLVPNNDGMKALEEVVNLYSEWIEEKTSAISLLEEEYHQDAAYRHMDECTASVERMKNGLNYLKENQTAKKAFQLANHAILLQQIGSSRDLRKAEFNPKENRLYFSPTYETPNITTLPANRGKWRAFQIAFLLMSIESTAKGEIPDRDTVELIWFPTGGGKTEAYLGLSAFAMFMRRLNNPKDIGVHVLMRYTLRLLTAQQFQRASALICAMEHLRSQQENVLGTEPFSIGIWVGGETTPNSRKDAIAKFKKLEKDPQAENPFIISKCPWCGAQLGPVTANKSTRSKLKAPNVLGYQAVRNTVAIKCSDSACEFFKGHGLPIYVIDEDIYEKRPSLIIGTVDKFALLAWSYAQPARGLFGIDVCGERTSSPPGLIIQDELHLISGPLGSVVGLYETVIEELCTDRRNKQVIKPKIVCSTATIRRYPEQVKALYGRSLVSLFPSPGIDASDSFFSRYALNDDGTYKRGRIYVGIHAPSLSSLQTTKVRSFSALLQAPVKLSVEERDPWWTFLMFFNSLRELGTTVSLLQSDIPGYLKVIRNRNGLDIKDLRRLWRVLELTGRIRSDSVAESISKLEVGCNSANNPQPIDVCLASNIIEVGVDIDRLAMMTVVGQPKTTSQYIQVTGRVGRRWWERPGLVITLYSPTRPRDRSHFEKFRSYHSSLYAQVEPTSVTPFSPPVLDRALHAIMTIYVRLLGDQQIANSPVDCPDNLIEQLRQIIIPRIELVDPLEVENFEKVFSKRIDEWKRWQRINWEKRDSTDATDIPLLRVAGQYASPESQRLSWATPMSMRNVDAECQAEITNLYLTEGEENG